MMKTTVWKSGLISGVWMVLLGAGFVGQTQAQTVGQCDCPGDFNGDNQRNVEDFAIFAEKYWLQDCPTQLPVYNVTSAGMSQEQQAALAQLLGVDVDEIPLFDGQATLIKPAEFQKVPTMPVTD